MGCPCCGLHDVDGVHRLRHLGCLSRQPLRTQELPLAVLLAGLVGRLASQLVWFQAKFLARLASFLTGGFDSALSGRFPDDVLLLPWRVLQSVLGKHHAFDLFQGAMENFERAEGLSEDDNDDPILRWNSCLRTIRKRKLVARPEDNYVPYGD